MGQRDKGADLVPIIAVHLLKQQGEKAYAIDVWHCSPERTPLIWRVFLNRPSGSQKLKLEKLCGIKQKASGIWRGECNVPLAQSTLHYFRR